MNPRVLCDDSVRVEMDGGDGRTLLVVTDGETLRFWAETADVEGVLGGTPLQLSAHGGFCRLETEGEVTRLEYGLDGVGRRRCAIPNPDLADALAWVRSLPSPHEA